MTVIAIDRDPTLFREPGGTVICHRIEVGDAFGNKRSMYLRLIDNTMLNCMNVGKVSSNYFYKSYSLAVYDLPKPSNVYMVLES